ncbi:hypothetical protein BN938_2758 [Mucinivorans hirudinis]|uniref:Uncharacterized protein n=1 Tax=Mucinivorans hirudinis TaxID=1433126 RepID=A0A060RB20_9BACT|nr:hypothetical protein BN938_2758 [Mucinivorans hirudinis]
MGLSFLVIIPVKTSQHPYLLPPIFIFCVFAILYQKMR